MSLKNFFCRLLEAKSVELMSLTVTAACILHNLALKNNDKMDIETSNYNLEESTDEEINQELCFPFAINQRNGIDKRNELASM